MRWHLALAIYRAVLPLLLVGVFPGWLLRMLRRGGLGTRLHERLAIYADAPDFEPCAAVHIHSVSVGETQLALKLIRKWREAVPTQSFVVATGTATGHAVATDAAINDVRVTYAPLDFPRAVRRYLDRFEPCCIVFIEAEVWPHLVLECDRRDIPMHLVNARLSPRSARRFVRLTPWVRPMFRRLAGVCTQEAGDAAVWQSLGVAARRVDHTGSLKFDPLGGEPPARRPAFAELLGRLGNAGPVVLASSTHAGEEAWIASAIREAAPDAKLAIAPRHAERREEVARALRDAGFHPLLRSSDPTPSAGDSNPVLVIDTTGELRNWTAHADIVIIGKSFLAHGGQNPCEAIQAGKPVIVGPHMENFQPLTRSLCEQGAVLVARDHGELVRAIRIALDPDEALRLTKNAARVLAAHDGATERIIRRIRNFA